MVAAWVIRSGKSGERDSWALQEGWSGGGWWEVPDLTPCVTREDVAAVVAESFPGSSVGKLNNFTGQLWALRSRIKVGDLIVMPLKTTKQIAIGRVKSGYTFLANDADRNKRHVVQVDWQRTDLPRTAVKQDLLFTLGSAMSIFASSKNHAVARLEHLLSTGADPGQVPSIPSPSKAKPGSELLDHDEDVDEPELSPDIEEVALNQITARIAEEFAGHGLSALVAELLTAEGFRCTTAPPGPDGGVDIIAGRGPLGLDDPMLLVQVKSGAQVSDPVVTQLHGVMTKFGADQGLLVAWGGVTKPARESMKTNLRVRLWEAAEVVDSVLLNYENLSEDTRAKLPLKRVWMLSDAGS
ncbi:restriction endonuclease [Nocardioides anomalus]|uniref:Restriction endonuclease n=1 Tax=Nocardioides anomalus TaxID=2712223 RepID=A0A6G6WAH6_9ACTN|nr:restriction endonuclease [Nocardioides anomalus]QIG42040.1 restriction endonuclease [Nocardioides anomalus]